MVRKGSTVRVRQRAWQGRAALHSHGRDSRSHDAVRRQRRPGRRLWRAGPWANGEGVAAGAVGGGGVGGGGAGRRGGGGGVAGGGGGGGGGWVVGGGAVAGGAGAGG